MLLSRNWLDEYIDISHLSDNEIAEGLTRSGIEVESVNKLVNSSGIVVAQITSIRKHPNADKLNICTITIGNNVEFEVVCGAQNVSEYIKVAYARVGSIVNGTQIDSTEIRGVISPGMLCSFSELGIDDKYIEENQSEGIAILSNSYELGLDVIDVLDFNDTVFELSLTPNRSDCLSIIGVSYELSAIFDLPFKQKTVVYPKVDNNKTLLNLNVTNQNVNYFSLLPLHKIKITESPQFIKSRLIASGIRPINNIIDITNYVMIETGQPLHAFDLHKTGTEFEVRSAFKNETLETLDGKKIVLTNDDIVVSNNDEALSLAGVMGGYNSRITKYTENIVLECAVFNREVIRQSSKVHLTRTDSSMRFEKGIDINKVELAMKMALNLLIEYANAKVSVNVVDYKSDDFIYDTSAIAVTLDKINKYIGHDVEVDTIVDILKRLHFNFKYENRVFYINKISRRQDITQDVCIIEEVMRLYGLDKIVGELPKLPLRKSVIEEYDPRTISIKNTLLGMGYTETISYSLTNLEKASIKLLDNQKLVELINPLSSERQYFRQSVVPSIVDTMIYNIEHQQQNCKIYELSKVSFIENEEYVTHMKLAGAISGSAFDLPIFNLHLKNDFYMIKGSVQKLLKLVGYTEGIDYDIKSSESIPSIFHPFQSAEIVKDNTTIGYIGKIHPSNTKYDIFVFEVDLRLFVEAFDTKQNITSVSKFPSMKRDLSVVVPKNTVVINMINAIRSRNISIMDNVTIYNIYQDEKLGDYKSVTFRMEFLNEAKTLVDEEVNHEIGNIISLLKREFNGELR